MTRVAIRGPVDGAGSVTLLAPVTEQDVEIELPTSGTHLSGANAEGMPQLNDGTPIVESGSNSDGEWTRWAGGTQQCMGRDLIVETNDIVNMPIAFISITYIVTPTHRGAVDRIINSTDAGRSTTSFVVRVQDTAGSFVTVDPMDYTATGRWK